MRFPLILTLAGALLVGGCATRETKPLSPPAPTAPAPTLTRGAEGHVVLGPYVQPAGAEMWSSLNFVWWSDAPGEGLLEWTGAGGKTGGQAPSQQQPYEGWVRHTARIDRPDGVSAVRVLAHVTVDGRRFSAPVREVRFAPGPGEPLRVAAVGDTGAGTENQRRIVEQITKANPHVLLITGDVAYDRGNWTDYRHRFFPYYGALMATTPFLPALGNHDVGNPAHMGQPFRMVWTPPDNFRPPADAGPYSLMRARGNRTQGPVPEGQATLRNYSADAGYSHFLCLDATADRDTMEQQIVPWARKDLADAKRRGRKWLIVFWHHPPYTRGAYRDNSLQWKDIRDLYVPMLREAGAHLVLLGHDHNFQRMEKDGITYIVTGAGGARLHPVHPDYDKAGQPPLKAYNNSIHSFTVIEQSADGNSLTVRQVDKNGRELDAATLTATPAG